MRDDPTIRSVQVVSYRGTTARPVSKPINYNVIAFILSFTRLDDRLMDNLFVFVFGMCT
jgi:hypothetical protein